MLPLPSLVTITASTLPASLAKSRSRTSCGETGTTANASLSSLIAAHPTYDNVSYTARQYCNVNAFLKILIKTRQC